MILQALAHYYELLQQDPDTAIAPPGYCTTGVSFALNISIDGELLDVFPLFDQVPRGKNLLDVPRRMVVPEQVKRSSGVAPNFMCDNNVYVLGITGKESGEAEYAQKRFDAFRQFNEELLQKADSDTARAVIAFLTRHDPSQARQHPAIAAQLEGLLKGGNLVFLVKGTYAHDDPVVKRVWDEYKAGQEALVGQCLVTGEIAPVARLHSSLKRVHGAQSSGATLVGFNAPAYESYNRQQGLNAPVSEKAAFAYTTALNYLLSTDNPHKPILLGDTTVVYWADSARKEYPELFASVFGSAYTETAVPDQQERKKVEDRLEKIASKVQRVQPLDVSNLPQDLDKNVRFYVLGLAPNAARISVRFFISEPFGKIIARIQQHYADLQIVKEFDDQPSHIPLLAILDETVSRKASDPQPAPLLAGSIVRAILTGSPYPEALFHAILTRVRVDIDDKDRKIKKINYARAAVIKAFLLRKYRHQPQNPFKETLTMSLNEQSDLPAYVLGRLFAVLEKVQQEAIGSVNASIKDRYFTSACATPRIVFPVLLRLSQHHIAKAEYGYTSDRRIQELLDRLDVANNPFPSHLTLDEQGVFILGYYHQRAAFYVKDSNRSSEPANDENLTILQEGA